MPKGERNAKLSKSDLNQVVKLYTTPNADGTWTGTVIIARLYGVSVNTVRHHLKRLGIPRRTSEEAAVNGKQCRPRIYPRLTDAPLCACGCGCKTQWNKSTKRWAKLIRGHLVPQPYHDRAWLIAEYIGKVRTAKEIAAQCGVDTTCILFHLRRQNIPVRSARESLVLRGSCSKSKNAAWRGGIANWKYASNWKRVARVIRKRDNYACKMCGFAFPAKGLDLQVHHIDSNRYNNSLGNLITVCRWDHPKGRKQEQLFAPMLAILAKKANDACGLSDSLSWRGQLRAVGIKA